jgi:ribonuclease HI
VGKKDESFIRLILSGRTLSEAAHESGLDEERARSFLESVARFAGSVGTPADFVHRTEDEIVLHTDGASSGNPGPSGAGGVLSTVDGAVLEEFHAHLGNATNNVAEYEAVRMGLLKAIDHGARRVTVRLDSELVANQLSGRYKVKDSKLIDRYLKVSKLLSRFESVRFEAIPREENTRADMLARMGARSARE